MKYGSKKIHEVKKAFTLAEIIITLLIIGVVASLVLPGAINNYKKHQMISSIKKAYSQFYKAADLSQVDNGSKSAWIFSATSSVANSKSIFDRYFKDYLKIQKTCPTGNSADAIKCCGGSVGSVAVSYILNDGSCVSFSSEANAYYLLIDANGQKNPNLLGKDQFLYMFNKDRGLYPYGFPTFSGVTREQIKKTGNYGCTTENISYKGYYCAALLMFDNWDMKNDYPW